MNKKSYSFDMETFRNMLQMCPKLPRQKFVDPPFEEEILTFIRELGYPGNIKLLSDVKVDTLTQPWRTFGTIINKCLSGGPNLLDRKQGVKEEQIYVLPKIHESYHQSLHVTRSIHSKKKQDRLSKTEQAPKPSPSKRVKATAKVAKSGKKKQSALGLETLSEVALTKAEQFKLATKRSLIQTHNSYASGSGAHKGTGVTPGVPDVQKYGSDDEQLSWKSSDEEDDDDEANVGKDEDDDEQTESNNDDEDFVHPKFTTHDDEARQEEVNKEDSFDPIMDEEATNAEGEDNELYRDVNVNLEGRDVEMIDAQQTNV
ncbi:hypothetical protein Tco_1480262 [Tanacetum coccineum]